jgi:biopolymer transport protein ExbD
MLTVPIVTHSVQLELAASLSSESVAPPVAVVDIDLDGTICCNDQPLPLAALAARR